MLLKKSLAASLSASILLAGLPSCQHKTNNESIPENQTEEVPTVITDPAAQDLSQVANAGTPAEAVQVAEGLIPPNDPQAEETKSAFRRAAEIAGVGGVLVIASIVAASLAGKYKKLPPNMQQKYEAAIEVLKAKKVNVGQFLEDVKKGAAKNMEEVKSKVGNFVQNLPFNKKKPAPAAAPAP